MTDNVEDRRNTTSDDRDSRGVTMTDNVEDRRNTTSDDRDNDGNTKETTERTL